MSMQFETQLVLIIVAIACAIPGSFLVIKKMAMMTDSITHTVLLGIVLGYFITKDLTSPLLVIGAALMGVITVWLTESLKQTRLVSEDASIGIIFPLLFSIAIILITKFAGSVHLDTDSVLLGEPAFIPFSRQVIAGIDIGPKALYSMGVILIINLVFVIVFFKELKLATFDPIFAAVLGFLPTLLHYGIMLLVSVTAVGAFESVGAVLVIALMIGPPAGAYLLTDQLKYMIVISCFIGAINAILGYQMAVFLDVSISGSIAFITGVTFFGIFLLSPKQGIIANMRLRGKQKLQVAEDALLIHLYQHAGTKEEVNEADVTLLEGHLKWKSFNFERLTKGLTKKGQLYYQDHLLKLTEEGTKYVVDILEETR